MRLRRAWLGPTAFFATFTAWESASPSAVPSSWVFFGSAVDQRGAVVGRRHPHGDVVRERDQRDAVPRRQLLDESASAASAASEPGRPDVVRRHRARDVDQQHDGRALLGLGELGLGPGEADEEQRERRLRTGSPGCTAAVPASPRPCSEGAPASPTRTPCRRGAGRARRRRRSPAGRAAGRAGARGDLKANGITRSRSCAGRRRAPRSQSPSVESATCRTPAAERSRTRPVRSSAAAAAKRSRSLRSLVSTRSWRPVSGSTRRSSPTSASSCSRGSRISTASVGWRPATRSSAFRQSIGPRKSETTTTSERWSASPSSSVERLGEPAASRRDRREARRASAGAPAAPGGAGASGGRRRRTRPGRAGCRAASPCGRRRARPPRRRPPCAARPCRTPSTPRRRRRAR